jgi:hypothetical protein
MNSALRNRFWFSLTVACLLGLAARTAHAQPQAFYSVQKGQSFVQTSSAGAVVDSINPFGFGAQADTSTTLTFPSGSTQALVFVSGDNSFEINSSFATKAALDAAFPNGTYRMTGTGIPTLSFNLTTDLYPTVTPSVTNGTWNAGGMLVVNPTQTITINLNTFTGYATSGVAGHMQTKIQGLSDNVRLPPNDNGGILSVANPFGITVQTTPITSITIPAGTLTSGRVYSGEVDFETASTFDSTSVPGSGVVAIYSKALTFYIAAATTGDGGPAPVITVQPTNQIGTAGGNVTFSTNFTVGGQANQFNGISFRWYFNGQEINLDGTKYSFPNNIQGFGLTINNLTAADAGSYSVTLIGTGGIVASNAATLTLAAAAAPAITTQPVAKNVASNSTVVFSVTATGTPTPTYQWRKDGVNVINGANGVSGGTGATLVINGASAASAGNYSVSVINSVGSVPSNAVALTVTTTNDPGRLINLSVLTDITAAVPSFTVGTVIGGSGTSGNKALVVRAVGPSLGALGVPGTIGDPQLTLFNSSSVAVTSNDNWNGDPSLLTAMASVGAFAFTGPTSKDAAIFQPSLAQGGYTVAASGVNGSAGTAIAEIYDAAVATFTPSSPRLINVSVLKQISAGGSLTLGFTLGGSVAKTVLIRAIGPGLAAVGLTSGTLGDPQLTLFNSNSVSIATNDDWGADPQLTNAGSRVGAFAIGNAQSKDAMLIITLPAGGYTARVNGGGGTSGTAIVEVYEVP